MVRTFRVASAADPRLSDYVGLTDVDRRTRVEPAADGGAGIFIGEGELVIRRALRAGYPLRSALVSPRWLPALEGVLRGTDAPVYVGDEPLLREVTGFHVHRGALASFGRRSLPTAAELLDGAHRVAVLEAVNTHTNVGAVFRCAAALGMDAVLLSAECADPLYRRAVRVSMGEVFAVPYARLERGRSPYAVLREHGFRILALTPDAAAVPLDRVAVGAVERVAVLIGAEGPGLSVDALRSADEAVRIPMARGVDSLNVAAAAAVAFWVLGRRDPDPPP